jgi:hypothetical protein
VYQPTKEANMAHHIETLADQIIADRKDGNINVEEVIFGKVNVCDLPYLAELLDGHGSSNERNTVDDALDAIAKALA